MDFPFLTLSNSPDKAPVTLNLKQASSGHNKKCKNAESYHLLEPSLSGNKRGIAISRQRRLLKMVIEY